MKRTSRFWQREPAPIRQRPCDRCKAAGIHSLAVLTQSGECWFFRCECGYEGKQAYCSPYQASCEYRNATLARARRERKQAGV